MDSGWQPITDADERAAVRRQAIRIVVRSALGTAVAAVVLALTA